jgi:hypothetical protein
MIPAMAPGPFPGVVVTALRYGSADGATDGVNALHGGIFALWLGLRDNLGWSSICLIGLGHRTFQVPAGVLAALTEDVGMELDHDKIDDVVLALLYLGLHDGTRAWKGFDWDVMNRLHDKGYISDPRSKAKSVVFTAEGLGQAKRLLEELFGKRP